MHACYLIIHLVVRGKKFLLTQTRQFLLRSKEHRAHVKYYIHTLML